MSDVSSDSSLQSIVDDETTCAWECVYVHSETTTTITTGCIHGQYETTRIFESEEFVQTLIVDNNIPPSAASNVIPPSAASHGMPIVEPISSLSPSLAHEPPGIFSNFDSNLVSDDSYRISEESEFEIIPSPPPGLAQQRRLRNFGLNILNEDVYIFSDGLMSEPVRVSQPGRAYENAGIYGNVYPNVIINEDIHTCDGTISDPIPLPMPGLAVEPNVENELIIDLISDTEEIIDLTD